MSNFANLVRVRNVHTGQIGRISRAVFENPRLNPGILVEVDDSAKPYLPGLYRSKYIQDSVETETPQDDLDIESEAVLGDEDYDSEK